MSNVVVLKPDRTRRSEPSADGAQILFFLGVRYVRPLDLDVAAAHDAAEMDRDAALEAAATAAEERLQA